MTLRDFVRLLGPMGPMTQTHEKHMPRPRRGRLLPIDASVLDAGRTLAPKDGPRFEWDGGRR